MQAESQKSIVVGGLLLAASMVGTPGNASEEVTGLPVDFLEYLSTLVDQEGEWIDALDLDDRALPEGGVNPSKVSSTADENRRSTDDNAE